MNIEFSPLLSRQWNALRIELFDSGYARLGTEWNQEHLSPPFSRLYYITGGAGVVEGGGQRLSLEPGFVYLLPLHLSLRYGCAEEIEQVYFHIAARTDAGFDLFSHCKQMLRLPMSCPCAQIRDAYRAGNYLQTALLECQVRSDLYRLIAAAGLEEKMLAPHSAFLQRVFSVVRQHLRSSLTLGEIAGYLSLSESSLTKRFRQEFGMPLGRYVDEMLFQEVCHLLAATSLTVSEIAERLDFCDQFYLARFFSRRQGVPPRAYRAASQGRI